MPNARQKLQQLRKVQRQQSDVIVKDNRLRSSVLTLGDRDPASGLISATDDQGNTVQVRELSIFSGGGRSLPGIVVEDGVGVFAQ